MTSSNALPPVSNILTGALAVTAIAAAMKVVNDAQKKREEEEAQSYQQAKNQAAKLNEAEAAKKAQQWLEGQAILNAQIEALQKLGASEKEIEALKEQASTQGLGIAINNAGNLSASYQEKKLAELMLADMTEAEKLEAYKATPEYQARQEALAEWQAQKDAEQAYQLYRQGEWASVPIQENIVNNKPWWQVILDPVAEFIAGVGYQAIVVNNLDPLVAIIPAPENAKNGWFAGWAQLEIDSTAFTLGRIVGGVLGIIQGAWEIASGIATATGGTLISCGTGVLCLGGGAASIVAGTALVAHGSVVLVNSAYNTGQQIKIFGNGGLLKPKPPGFTPKWKKEGKKWVNPKTGEKWYFHAEDATHYAHWDVEIPGGGKERIPLDPKKGVFKE